MLASKTSDENFLQSMSNEIATKADRDHQFEMKIRKHKMLSEGIKPSKD